MKRGIAVIVGLALAVGVTLGLVTTLRPAFVHELLGSSIGAHEGSQPLGILSDPDSELRVGEVAPDFALRALDGTLVKLSDYRGEKNVILNFWATWCPPCREEMPDFERIYQEHANQLVVLGVNLLESPDDIRRFLRNEVGVTYPILLDRKGEVAQGYRLFTQPTTFFIDEEGRFVAIGGQLGKFGAFTSQELEQRVEESLIEAGAQASKGLSTPSRRVEPSNYRTGNLSGRYFTPAELERLGFEVDPFSVKYVASLDKSQLRSGGPTPDAIPSIDAPRFETVMEADEWLEDDDLVMTVEYREIVRAYPIAILNWHEIVNDRLGDLPVAVTFCPLCNSGIVFVQPVINGELAEFGTSGRLYHSDLVMYDRVTGTFWAQIEGRPLVGPLVGEFGKLERLPSSLTRWGHWKGAHPDAEVLARPTSAVAMGGQPPLDSPEEAKYLRDYSQNPYSGYVREDRDTFGTPFNDARLRAKAVVSGIEVNTKTKAYLKSAVQDVGLLNDDVGGAPLLVLWSPRAGDVVVFERTREIETEGRPWVLEFALQDGQLRDNETGTVWGWDGQALAGPLAEAGAQLKRVVSMTTFWFAWVAFHPETELYTLDQSESSKPSD